MGAMNRRTETAPHIKTILREKVFVPRSWLRHNRRDVGRALILYGSLIRAYAPFGGGSPLARAKLFEDDLMRDGYSNAPVVMLKEIRETAMAEANNKVLDLVVIDNPMNADDAEMGCPHCGWEYSLQNYDLCSEIWDRSR